MYHERNVIVQPRQPREGNMTLGHFLRFKRAIPCVVVAWSGDLG